MIDVTIKQMLIRIMLTLMKSQVLQKETIIILAPMVANYELKQKVGEPSGSNEEKNGIAGTIISNNSLFTHHGLMTQVVFHPPFERHP